ncbi:MAG TPA: hypothetical protein VGH56_01305 [Solirubrobacteraceae bacterium]
MAQIEIIANTPRTLANAIRPLTVYRRARLGPAGEDAGGGGSPEACRAGGSSIDV